MLHQATYIHIKKNKKSKILKNHQRTPKTPNQGPITCNIHTTVQFHRQVRHTDTHSHIHTRNVVIVCKYYRNRYTSKIITWVHGLINCRWFLVNWPSIYTKEMIDQNLVYDYIILVVCFWTLRVVAHYIRIGRTRAKPIIS